MAVGSWIIIPIFVSFATLLQLQPRAHARSIELAMAGTGAAVELELEPNYACNYHYEVKTGDVPYAGTDSMITFGIYRSDGSGFNAKVDGAGWFSGRFEQGRTDAFDVDNWCMHPCRLILHSNGAGAFADWYVEWVRVTVTGHVSDEHTFHVNTWIGPNSDQGYTVDVNNCNNQVTTAD